MYTYIMPSKLYVNIYLLYLYIIHGLKCVYIYNTNIADSSHGPALRISIQQRDCLQVTEPVVWSEEPCCTCWLFLHIYIYIYTIYTYPYHPCWVILAHLFLSNHPIV